ncbi:MAG TPA: Rieske 2Fe-2S domain-containing protein [Stellaceae bacterium]|jgi:nitrite reductase/ring-hydroxylating ferredoxin subunit
MDGAGTAAQTGAYAGHRVRPIAPSGGERLTQTAPGTPGGEYLRRYWHPFMLASELGGLPVAVRLLSEDLVVFRDRSGRIGLLHKQCLHRGASLEFGIIQERGIACCYHGWHFDIDGTILATPAEPETSRIRHNFCQGAYPVREACGLLFAYLGPPETTPAFPYYDTFSHPEGGVLANFKMFYPCSWLQICENAADPIHNAYLHAISSGLQFSAPFREPPALDYVETPIGFLSMATRRVGDFVFIRSSDVAMPNFGQFAGGSNPATTESFFVAAYTTRWVTAIDDNNAFYIGIRHINDRNPSAALRSADPSQYGVGRMGLIGQTDDRPYDERQREPGDYDACVSQGAVANRRAEHLGTTDRGIVMLRRMLSRGIDAVERGEEPEIPRLYRDEEMARSYCHELVFRVPPGSNIGDAASLGAFGRQAAEIVIATDHLSPVERERVASERIRGVLAGAG